MKFYVIPRKGVMPKRKALPYVVLISDNWNDYGYETLFHASFFNKDGNKIELGDVKILHKDSVTTRDVIDEVFVSLDEEYYCSLGQDIEYYEVIMSLGDAGKIILAALNDVVYKPQFETKFSSLEGFENSLLRFSEARMALTSKPFQHHNKLKHVRRFVYETTLKKATSSHNVEFDFEKNLKLPYRINAIIGRNGTGKTEILARLGRAFSGYYEKKEDEKEGYFNHYPNFNKVIAVSYSVFDDFAKPFEDNPDDERSFSYVYCGMRKKGGNLKTLAELKDNIFECYSIIKKNKREESWQEILEQIFEEEHRYILNNLDKYRNEWLLSSGQSIVLSTITEIIAKIEEDSILLFDEPELHLHPNAISNLVRMLNLLLEEFNSYAIISTHSPLIIQEIPSRYVRLFERMHNTPAVRNLSRECFGENITNIVNDIFDVRNTESNYKQVLEQLAEKMEYQEILSLFENNLSLNAMTYLNIVYSKDKEG